MRIPGFQRRYLRGLAHALDPVVHIGRSGLSETVLAEVDKALSSHELIKVRMPGDKAEKREWIARLEAEVGSREVGLVGHVATLYREHAEPESRKIRLPKRESE